MIKPQTAIWNAQAVTNGNTFRSAVTRCPRGDSTRETGVTVEVTTATGTLSLEVNNKSEQDYQRDVAAASGGLEANNTAGWVQQDLSPSTTIAVGGTSTFTIMVKSRFLRWRLKFACTLDGSITARAGYP